MRQIEYISRMFGETYIIWIEKINQWILFEEPAFFVFTRIVDNLKVDAIIPLFKLKFNTKTRDAEDFVKDLKAKIDELLQSKVNINEESIYGVKLNEILYTMRPSGNFRENIWSSHVYESNGKYLKFIFASELSEYYIHHSFSHLKTNDEVVPDIVFEVFEDHGYYVLLEKQPNRRQWICADIPTLKRRVFIEFGNGIHAKDNHSWMSIIHGAALAKGQSAILLCSSTGSGKSTLAALMQKEGYTILSDDYVPVEYETQKIYPFPAAFSVKSGSFELLSEFYPELLRIPEKEFRLTNKSLRFIPPSHIEQFNYHPANLNCIFFIKYNAEKDIDLAEIELREALPLFNEEAWVSHEALKAESFIDWFSGLRYFKLEYGNSSEVVGAINKITEQYSKSG